MAGSSLLDEDGNGATISIKTPKKTSGRLKKPKRKKYTAKVVQEGKPVRTPKTPAKTTTMKPKRKYTRKKAATPPPACSPCEPRCIATQSVKRMLNFDLEDPPGSSPRPAEPCVGATQSVGHALNFEMEDRQGVNCIILLSPWLASAERQDLNTCDLREKEVRGSPMTTSPRLQILKTYVRRKKKIFNSLPPDAQMITSPQPQISNAYVQRKKQDHHSVIPSSASGEAIDENVTDTQLQRVRKRKRSHRCKACTWYPHHDLERTCSLFFSVRKKRRTLKVKRVSLKNRCKSIYAIQDSYGTFTLPARQTSDCMPVLCQEGRSQTSDCTAVLSQEAEKEDRLAEAQSIVDSTLRRNQTSDCMRVLCEQEEKESGLAKARCPADFTLQETQTSETSDCMPVLSEGAEKESLLAEVHCPVDFTFQKMQTSDCMPVLSEEKEKEIGLAEAPCPVDFTIQKTQTSDCMPVLSEEKEKESGLAEARSSADLHKISPSTPEKAPGYSTNQQKRFYGPQARIEALMAIQRKTKGVRNKKREGYKTVSSPVMKKSPQSSEGKNANHQISKKDENDIVRMLKRLTIKDGYENALVLYAPKDDKPEVQVDLDPESKKVWELWLRTGNFGDDGDGNMDRDQREWWEQERRIFAGRIDSFNSRMCLILGTTFYPFQILLVVEYNEFWVKRNNVKIQ